MKQIFINDNGGLTTNGYILFSVIAIVLLVLAIVILKSKDGSSKLTITQIATCGLCLALAYVTSYIKVFKMPFGGSITLFSMLFIVLIGYWYGVKVGILAGIVYGIFQFLQEPYFLTFFQVCCDYFLAFGAMGLAGLFSKSKKHGLLKAYLIAIIARGAFHTLGGYLYWMSYMPEDFPQSLKMLYPFIYNYSYIFAEGIITIIIISIPSVREAINRVSKLVGGRNYISK